MSSILSVGIDIGTTTTQVMFSRITLENTGGYFSAPRISIIGQEVIYKSPVRFTPLKTPTLLDGDGVREIVAREFQNAGFRPADTDTGAVIITGESARKENAAVVLEKLSDFAGEFVVSTAGPDLESVIAGKGSGACGYSLRNDCTAVNLDIGGGTTNLALFDCGEPVERGCFDIGGRLIRLSGSGAVESVSAAAALVAEAVGVPLRVGQRAEPAALERITDKMADLLAQALGLAEEEPLLLRLRTPGSSRFSPGRHISRICFSGGVADCIWDGAADDPLRYGDIGVYLGRSIGRSAALTCPRMLLRASETIRATVVGAGTYATSLSGSTISYSPDVFPVKNVPALKLTPGEQTACFDGDEQALRRKAAWFLEQSGGASMLLALRGRADPTYAEVKRLAGCIARALDGVLPPEAPVLVAVEEDIAKALGGAIRAELGGRRRAACIDSVRIGEGDYVDIGRPLMDGLVVPVVVKTLLFG